MGPSLLVSRFDSVVLLILFMAFLGYLFISAKDSIPEETTTLSMKKAYGLFLIGLIGLPIAGQLVITGAIHMASQFHISEALISLFAVALGTSLPELATAVVAVKKRKPDLVIGNIIGSNIFNILLVVGISSGIRSIQVNPIFMFEFGVLFIASICLMVTMITLKRHKFDRIEASLFLLSYAVYIGYIFVRG
jgi:cation:H+ antiporter